MSRPENPELVKNIRDIVVSEVTEKGIDKLSVRKVAGLADISPTTIYYYYKDKQGLIEAVKLNLIKEMDRYVAKHIKFSDSCKDQLESLMRAYIEWGIKNPHLFDIVFDKLPEEIKQDQDEINAYYGTFFRAMYILDKGKTEGEFSFVDEMLDTTLLFTSMYGVVKCYHNKRLHPDYWNKIDNLIDLVILRHLKSVS